jgi:hypothetical protein
MSASPARVVVFTGPSLSPQEAAARLPDASVSPPARRDDIYQARTNGAEIILLIDGVFAHHLAVSPREIVDVIDDGAVVIGASSMGALRAVDCAPAGAHGIGLVYRLFRRGVLESDDEVAVATNPERHYEAASVALVNVRCAAQRARRARLIANAVADRLCAAAERTFYPDRTWTGIFEAAGVDRADSRLLAFCRGVDVKRDDARRAVEYVRGRLQQDGFASTPSRNSDAWLLARSRYPGHDPSFGLPQPALQRALCEWLFGSGRYQTHAWALVAGEPELHDVPPDPVDRVYAIRDRLAAALARMMATPDQLAERVWTELEYLDELDAELMRWHAHHALADEAERRGWPTSDDVLMRTQEEIARRHGLTHWLELDASVRDDRLYGAIPVTWIESAVDVTARARTAGRYTRPAGQRPHAD